MDIHASFPKKLVPELLRPHKYKVAHGGRGGGKSTAFAKALLLQGLQKPLRVLCVRETQRSIRDSVHRLLVDQIAEMGMAGYYNIQQIQITGTNGTEFTFAGLSDQTAASLKSYEKADRCWAEEAHVITENSWRILLPTLFRKEGCECWVSFNPELDTDPTWVQFVEKPPPDTWRVEMNYHDNPWFPKELDERRLHDKNTLPEYEYNWIWEGKCKPAVTGAVYADQMAELFATERVTDVLPDASQAVYAVFDLGWNDATAIVICQRHLSSLRVIDYFEGSHKTYDDLSAILRAKPYHVSELFLPHDGAHDHQSGMSAQRAFEDLRWTVNVLPNQPVEDGIRALRMAFKSLYIHKDCKRLVECLKRYRRTIPATTGEPSKPAHDEFSHGADAMRYAALAAPQMDSSIMSLPKLNYGKFTI